MSSLNHMENNVNFVCFSVGAIKSNKVNCMYECRIYASTSLYLFNSGKYNARLCNLLPN